MVSKQTSINPDIEIRINPMISHVVGGQVSASGISAGEDGRKIIKAGTPVGASADFLLARDTVLSASSSATAQGLLLKDVDVTNGNASADILVQGVVDNLKIKRSLGDSNFALYINSTVKEALSKITFQSGRND